MKRYNNDDIRLVFHDMEIVKRISKIAEPAPFPLGSAYGIEVMIDPFVPPGEVHVRSKDGHLLKIIPLTKTSENGEGQ